MSTSLLPSYRLLSDDELRDLLIDLWRQRRTEYRMAAKANQERNYVLRDMHRLWALHRGHDIQMVLAEMKDRKGRCQ